ncbi:type II secretion system minor pseudopilin GspK [Glaciecola sp. 1036]|uniref:type II secretion system minor pseudopilin GspK n=1 Tax=Alteromonadaceae TaxID=72275 RepID=UPI003CFE801F
MKQLIHQKCLDCPANKSKTHQSGVALIIVLLIVALISILATQMTARLQLNIARTLNIKDNNQAYWYSLGAEHFAKKSLREMLTLNTGNINLEQPWAENFEFPVEGGVIQASITDLQSCFNINGVYQSSNPNPTGQSTKPEELVAFETLLKHFIEDSLVVDTVRDSVVDWLDDDDRPSDYGAEDLDYESLPQPYLAANSLIANISELRLINGVEDGVRQGWLANILPYLCAIPEQEYKLNVNTVTQENAIILSALTGLSVDDASSLIDSRPPGGYDDINDFFAEPEISALGLSPIRINWFDVTTKYFKLSTLTKMTSGSQFKMVTVFKIEPSGNSISIVSREFGGM